MSAYYNEIDPYAAQWLRNLIAAGHIAPGDVDERSIVDVRPEDLRGYTQCHFFAGIGVWPYALRRAGFPDDRSIWSGSAPCQPFSVAGKGRGHEDERHLWPAWFGLIGESRPVRIVGEQVADGDGAAWLDHVGHDLESIGYAVGAVSSAACGFGCPGERQRIYFVADTQGGGCGEFGRPDLEGNGRHPDGGIEPDGLGDTIDQGLEGHGGDGDRRQESGWHGSDPARSTAQAGGAGGMADADGRHASAEGIQRSGQYRFEPQDSRAVSAMADTERDRGQESIFESGNGDAPARERETDGSRSLGAPDRSGPTNGFWRDADWLLCRDGKWRPVRPGTFPLVTGAPSRMGRLRAYGNGLNAAQAEAFARAYLEVRAA